MQVLVTKLCPWTFSLLSIKKGILFFLFRGSIQEKARIESNPDMMQPAFVCESEVLLFLVEIFKMGENVQQRP